MCGRYTLFTDEELREISEIVREAEENSNRSVKTGEVFPTDIAPVLLEGGRGMEAHAMQWGFPGFDGKGVVFNARSETALDKPMFRKSLLERRCIVPSTGFYEWHTEGKQKTKFLFNLPRTQLLYMAGIYNEFKIPGSAEKHSCFTILTTAPNQWMKDVHNRMPVVLEPSEYEPWLSGHADLLHTFHRDQVELGKQVVME